MATIIKPITILHYEDSPSYRDSFKGIAQANRIIVDAVDNVDLLIEKLEEDHKKHKFVVLDARAFLHEGQKTGSESEANLIKIFREIERISNEQQRFLPYCINTGFADVKVSHSEVVNCEIFEKGNEQALINFIWDTYNNSTEAVLRKNYPDCFEFADAYFDEPNLAILSEILKGDTFKSDSIATRVMVLASLRRLNEHLMDVVFDKYLNNSSGIIQKNSSRSSDVFNYINDKEGILPHIYYPAINLYKVTSNFGSHSPEDAQKIADYPSSNTTISLIHNFLDLVTWAKKLIN
ncbi:hypothetical protein SAMN05192574_110137 [Mucilaginibacter gossypiicola]|uniref:Uncharacterized protein n=1 Tax=Mucilaginibacter gossypiicola TaxID=551995 RepID=A0A1H8RFU8_9SPHI|nr:hypothetical protein [Mucilaginibacter gossypiicola]SEO65305.1 hypothetical protein SAMN05192574_110137 [Mucilaginibacter gossypiicola]